MLWCSSDTFQQHRLYDKARNTTRNGAEPDAHSCVQGTPCFHFFNLGKSSVVDGKLKRGLLLEEIVLVDLDANVFIYTRVVCCGRRSNSGFGIRPLNRLAAILLKMPGSTILSAMALCSQPSDMRKGAN